MKKILFSTIVMVGVGSSLIATPVEIPNWQSRADELASICDVMSSYLAQDVTLYNDLDGSIVTLHTYAQEISNLRQNAFDCISSTYNSLVDSLNNCQNVNTSLIESYSSQLGELKDQLSFIESSVNDQIASLQDQQGSLEQQLTVVDSLYDYVVGDAQSLADRVYDAMKQVQELYYSTIDEKQSLLENIATLNEQIQSFADEQNSKLTLLTESICNTPVSCD